MSPVSRSDAAPPTTGGGAASRDASVAELGPEDDTAERAARLRLAIHRLNRQVRQNMAMGITPSRLSIMAILHKQGPIRPADLAEREAISRPSVTRLAAGLEEAGLLERTPDPDDGRACLLSLTEAGHELVVESKRRATAFLAVRLGEVDADPEAVDAAIELLELLAVLP